MDLPLRCLQKSFDTPNAITEVKVSLISIFRASTATKNATHVSGCDVGDGSGMPITRGHRADDVPEDHCFYQITQMTVISKVMFLQNGPSLRSRQKCFDTPNTIFEVKVSLISMLIQGLHTHEKMRLTFPGWCRAE